MEYFRAIYNRATYNLYNFQDICYQSLVFHAGTIIQDSQHKNIPPTVVPNPHCNLPVCLIQQEGYSVKIKPGTKVISTN